MCLTIILYFLSFTLLNMFPLCFFSCRLFLSCILLRCLIIYIYLFNFITLKDSAFFFYVFHGFFMYQLLSPSSSIRYTQNLMLVPFLTPSSSLLYNRNWRDSCPACFRSTSLCIVCALTKLSCFRQDIFCPYKYQSSVVVVSFTDTWLWRLSVVDFLFSGCRLIDIFLRLPISGALFVFLLTFSYDDT